MSKLIVTDTNGETREVEGEEGLSVMELIRDNDFDDLVAMCGGSCSCCTCHIYVEEEHIDRLPSMQDDEKDLLEDSESFKPGVSRLSCQIEFTDEMDGLQVTIAPEE